MIKFCSSFFLILQDKAFALVVRVLTAYKTSEIESAAKTLETQQMDVLMKYIYRGFAEPSDSFCACLLIWHDKVCFLLLFV